VTNEATTLEIESDRVLVITRTFAAPRRVVFDAITKPEHVRRWYGCDAMTMTVCEIDLRPGGRWRYVLRMTDGSEHGFGGEYREVVPPERIVCTENYEPLGPGHEMVATVTLEEHAGRTTLQNRLVYQSRADRDGHIGAGMEAGMRESHERLAALVASLM
jgi:uncharacterized protein YndB with AHSA1/START domain